MRSEPVGPVNAVFRTPSNPAQLAQRKGELHAGARTALQLPRPVAHPPRWEQYDRGINDRVNGFKLLVQRSPSLSSRAVQEPNDHARAFLYRGAPMPYNDVQPPQNGAKQTSILYDREHREGRLYAKRLNPTPNYAPQRVK
ncbi:hypothetical protein AB1Y20_007767 [Prymnesium parvum]|uniref:Cilia- and flagella-associated protein 206 n=1 Tax=Prymnesium parvum TaxID=97485 RepID=A0AB34IUQ3_PRYPA